MQLNLIRDDDSVTHVALVGRLDVSGVNEIQYDFHHQTTLIPKATVVDLSRVTFIASLGMGMLISTAKYLERHGKKMVLLGPPELVRRSLEAAHLEWVIPIAHEEAAALELVR